jgi:hypothetical protein
MIFVPHVKLLFSGSVDGTILAWSEKGVDIQTVDFGGAVFCLAWNAKRYNLVAGGNGNIAVSHRFSQIARLPFLFVFIAVFDTEPKLHQIHPNQHPKSPESAPKAPEAAPKAPEAAPKSPESPPKSPESPPKSTDSRPQHVEHDKLLTPISRQLTH